MAPAPAASSSSYTLPLDTSSVAKINKLSDGDASLLPAEIVCGMSSLSSVLRYFLTV